MGLFLTSRQCVVLIAALVSAAALGLQAQPAIELPSDEASRRPAMEALTRQIMDLREKARELARQKGWPVSGAYPVGGGWELAGMENGEPVYVATDNINAAISTAANQVRNISPYNLNGGGLIVGLWDSGGARATHVEFGGRVTVLSTFPFPLPPTSNHATHVAGTIGAAGVDASALGMAPSVNIFSYIWDFDTVDMNALGMTAPLQPGKIYLSNHSYGTLSGWDYGDHSGVLGYHWFGDFGFREDDSFGQYTGKAGQWDNLCYNRPYYLPFKSAGNDRSDNAPSNGSTYYYLNGGWQTGIYNSSTGPYNDGYDSGFDTIPTYGCAKNIMTVGAANDAVLAGVRSVANGTITTFSGWGPTDDGRIKPDIVANGAGLYSSEGDSDTDYANYSGTSMSTPNTAGSAILLQEYYRNLFPGGGMRNSTLKGLILHTADDTGNTGPDYTYGWGLMNDKAAADQIRAHQQNPDVRKIHEDTLSLVSPTRNYTVYWDGVSPLTATLCWTDPQGSAQSGLDNSTIVLVNDLDLRVTGPGGAPTYMPWVLNPAIPSALATTGDNIRDVVEQVRIGSPGTNGLYTITISHKGALSGSTQNFSLLVSGQNADELLILPKTGFQSSGPEGTGPFLPACGSAYTLRNLGPAPVDWAVDSLPVWVDSAPSSGTLAPGATVAVTLCVNANALAQPAGRHTGQVVIGNLMSGKFQAIGAELNVTGCLSIPFSEDFETGAPPEPYWTLTGTNQFRTQVAQSWGAHGGSHHLLMDDSVSDSTFSANRLTLCLNLAGQSGLYLKFWAREFGDETTLPASNPVTNTANYDGLAFSNDGVNWHVLDLVMANQFTNLTGTYAEKLINLDSAVALLGLSYTSPFYIRWSQYDDDPIVSNTGTDGVALDDINITVGPPPTPTPSPTPSPTVSPTASPSASPTLSPSPTPNAARDWTRYE